MVITIDSADFSNANNGTLDTVPVKKIIGKGANHSIPNFINIGETANWSITLDTSKADNFVEYSIKMGDDVITPTVEENIMTINISDVNKPVLIYVKTNIISNTLPDDPVTPPSSSSQKYDFDVEPYGEVTVETIKNMILTFPVPIKSFNGEDVRLAKPFGNVWYDYAATGTISEDKLSMTIEWDFAPEVGLTYTLNIPEGSILFENGGTNYEKIVEFNVIQNNVEE